jgi:hypothetical protein
MSKLALIATALSVLVIAAPYPAFAQQKPANACFEKCSKKCEMANRRANCLTVCQSNCDSRRGAK